ncbi:hypothetical protein QCD70_04160 [Agreia sp. PsM10]|uniref:hypothetical protein n=1 Tax=Agreia sp. PsM10 TaxID=3030533 RepID=UPI00263B5A41|nr:hypothetical protein [Agreia sp. PsM10]MDN4639431.1 hypothetical protein [Agreia sp. PsM10]
MSSQFILVIEANLSVSSWGAKISTTEPTDERSALDLLERVIRGEALDVYTPHKKGISVRVDERTYLDLSVSKATPARQTRLTVAEVVAERS